VQLLCESSDTFAYFLVTLHNQGSWDGAYQFGLGLSGRESRQCFLLLLLVVVPGGDVILTFPLLLPLLRWDDCISSPIRWEAEELGEGLILSSLKSASRNPILKGLWT